MDLYAENRSRLAAEIGTDAIAIVPAASETIRNADVMHEFRQDSDFVYLTGLEEPDAVCVILPGHADGDFHLFVRPRDREAEIWTGFRTGTEGARSRFRADASYELSELDAVLPRLMLGRDVLYYRLGNARHDSRITELLAKARSYHERYGKPAPWEVRDIGRVLGRMRLRKSESEIESLRAACELTAEGHREAMRFARPGMYEYQVQAAMEYVWREGGSRRNGYPSIVASGANAVVLHYVENDRLIEEGDLILIDAGAEIDHYSSDLTRTFPAGGSFAAAQRALYEVVLAAERAGIAAARPGATIHDVRDRATEVVAEGLVELGLVPRELDDTLAMHHYREFFMHGTSHWLGLDVHDAGTVRVEGKPTVLEPGMVFTVEPGIYVAEDRDEIDFPLLEYDLDAWIERRVVEGVEAAREKEAAEKEAAGSVRHTVPAAFLGLGVRIEDDILITDEGHENLTSLAPTDPDRIEMLCSEVSWLQRA